MMKWKEGKSREEVRDLMRQNLNVMREAVEKVRLAMVWKV